MREPKAESGKRKVESGRGARQPVLGFPLSAFRFSLLVALILAAQPVRAQWPTDYALEPPWPVPSVDRVKTDVLAWLETTAVDETIRNDAEAIWSDVGEQPAETELLDRAVRTFALADERAKKLVALCVVADTDANALLQRQAEPDLRQWLTAPETPLLLAANMRLLYGRYLVHVSLIDEAHEQLDGLTPDDVVAPATLLFYQGVVCHSLLKKKEGLEAIGRLLEGAPRSPHRYIAVAEVMQRDLEALKDDSLDHIARRMDDIRRRLELARAGPRVRKIEDGVIESLDKMIKDLEEQQKKKGGGSSGQGTPSGTPVQDSRIMGGKGPGNVKKRPIGAEADWGDLPAKEREETLQQMGRELPSHYRDIIEQYFRRMAAEGSE